MPTLSIPHIRLVNQQLLQTLLKTPKEVVSWMGAMQAQDYNMAKWAIGTRLPTSTNKQLEAALCKGSIVRTHILRPTWHFVAKEDIRWMLMLTAPRIKLALASYDKNIGLTKATVPKAHAVIREALEGGCHLTKQEIGEVLGAAGVEVRDNHMLGHILFHGELDGLVCSGAIKNKKQTYRLLEELAAPLKKFDKDRALEKLAERFFTSHAPATLQDFTWWSGLTGIDAKKVLEMVKPNFVSEEIEGDTYWLNNDFKGFEVDKNMAHLLPAFDEYVVSYKDRKAIFEHGYYSNVISTNGIFKPTVMVNGQVVGMWKRVVKGKKTTAQVELFKTLSKAAMSALAAEVEKFELYNIS
jgi:hypothetical protein